MKDWGKSKKGWMERWWVDGVSYEKIEILWVGWGDMKGGGWIGWFSGKMDA